MSNQPVIRSRREAKVYAIAVISSFVTVPVLVLIAIALGIGGAAGGFWLFFILAIVLAVVATRYSRHLTAYTRHQKETQ